MKTTHPSVYENIQCVLENRKSKIKMKIFYNTTHNMQIFFFCCLRVEKQKQTYVKILAYYGKFIEYIIRGFINFSSFFSFFFFQFYFYFSNFCSFFCFCFFSCEKYDQQNGSVKHAFVFLSMLLSTAAVFLYFDRACSFFSYLVSGKMVKNEIYKSYLRRK